MDKDRLNTTILYPIIVGLIVGIFLLFIEHEFFKNNDSQAETNRTETIQTEKNKTTQIKKEITVPKNQPEKEITNRQNTTIIVKAKPETSLPNSKLPFYETWAFYLGFLFCGLLFILFPSGVLTFLFYHILTIFVDKKNISDKFMITLYIFSIGFVIFMFYLFLGFGIAIIATKMAFSLLLVILNAVIIGEIFNKIIYTYKLPEPIAIFLGFFVYFVLSWSLPFLGLYLIDMKMPFIFDEITNFVFYVNQLG